MSLPPDAQSRARARSRQRTGEVWFTAAKIAISMSALAMFVGIPMHERYLHREAAEIRRPTSDLFETWKRRYPAEPLPRDATVLIARTRLRDEPAQPLSPALADASAGGACKK